MGFLINVVEATILFLISEELIWTHLFMNGFHHENYEELRRTVLLNGSFSKYEVAQDWFST